MIRTTRAEKMRSCNELYEEVKRVFGMESVYSAQMREVCEFWANQPENLCYNPPTEMERKEALRAQVVGLKFEMLRAQGKTWYTQGKRTTLAPDHVRGLAEEPRP